MQTELSVFELPITPLLAEFTLAHVTASLNLISTILLTFAIIAIKQKKITLHRNLMLTAFAVSSAFLVVYLTRYALEGNKQFPADVYPTAAWFYYGLLASHLLLAITVPFVAILAIYHGLKDNREKHRRISKLAFPIWYYVSVTGVVIYVLLYWVFTVAPGEAVG